MKVPPLRFLQKFFAEFERGFCHGLEGRSHLRVRASDSGGRGRDYHSGGDGGLKNTRRLKTYKVRTGGARTQNGMSEDFKALVAYWMAYYDFLEAMSQDARFVWLYGTLEE